MIPPIGCHWGLAEQRVSDGLGNGRRPGDADASGPGRRCEGNRFGIVIGGSDDDELIETSSDLGGIGTGRGPGVGQENGDFARCPRSFELGCRCSQAEGEVSGAMATQAEEVGDDSFGSAP